MQSKPRRLIAAVGVSIVAFFELCLTGQAKLSYRLAHHQDPPRLGRALGRRDGTHLRCKEGMDAPVVYHKSHAMERNHGKIRQTFSGGMANHTD